MNPDRPNIREVKFDKFEDLKKRIHAGEEVDTGELERAYSEKEKTPERMQQFIELLSIALTRTQGKLKDSRAEASAAKDRVEELVYDLFHANVDPLTGTFLREFFEERLKNILKYLANPKETRHPELLGVIVIRLDVNKFKRFNEAPYSMHKGGDDVMRAFGDRLKKSVKDFDIVGRIGGDEYAIIVQIFDPSVDPQTLFEEIITRINGGETKDKKNAPALTVEIENEEKNIMDKVTVTATAGYSFVPKLTKHSSPEEIARHSKTLDEVMNEADKMERKNKKNLSK